MLRWRGGVSFKTKKNKKDKMPKEYIYFPFSTLHNKAFFFLCARKRRRQFNIIRQNQKKSFIRLMLETGMTVVARSNDTCREEG